MCIRDRTNHAEEHHAFYPSARSGHGDSVGGGFCRPGVGALARWWLARWLASWLARMGGTVGPRFGGWPRIPRLRRAVLLSAALLRTAATILSTILPAAGQLCA